MWACPDRIGYAIPAIALVALLGVTGTAIGIYLYRDALGPPALRRTLATGLSVGAATITVLVGVVTAVCGVVEVSGAYGRWLVPIGAALTAAGLAVLAAVGRRRFQAAANLTAALVVLTALGPIAVLALPLVAIVAGTFAAAAVLHTTTRQRH